jgi:hypothetical protein
LELFAAGKFYCHTFITLDIFAAVKFPYDTFATDEFILIDIFELL